MTKKIIAGALLAVIGLTAMAIAYRGSAHIAEAGKTQTATAKKSVALKKNITTVLQNRATAIKPFLQKGGYNEEVCFFIDMSVPSGKERFFIYDLKKGRKLAGALVAHGSGGNSTFEKPGYSNQVGSNCTSLGRYKIGKSYYGQFGLAYKLHGLDKTNSNAFNRFVVLHAHECVPSGEIYPDNICMSYGCPTVSPGFLNQLATYINTSEKPVLLEIYEGQ